MRPFTPPAALNRSSTKPSAGERRTFPSTIRSKDLAITVLWLVVLVLALRPLFQWAIFDAVWTGKGSSACAGADGACWIFVADRFGQFMFGTYPAGERWRVMLVFAAAALGAGLLLMPRVPRKPTISVLMLTAFPAFAVVLLLGGVFGLRLVPTSYWGGLMLTLVLAAATIVLTLPLGLVLALARQGTLPVIKYAAIGYIEFWRGLPLLGVLFMASTMFPLFVPQGITIDKLIRALIAFTLFNSAYMAEAFRGGLQSVGRGQHEAAGSLSLSYWLSMRKVILPQAIRVAMPGIVNVCINIFKMTSVFLTIGIFEFLGMIQSATADPQWLGDPSVIDTGYLFAGFVYWIACFSMSRYSRGLERRRQIGRSA